ncbi:MAG: tripartite tricarboxylate transporter substrate binding protein [Betaproteobacteria bacterium]|nr:tripartite tricarboxylate transporter substrate binding protein [Betaproteobacteria bacterium]
MKFICSVVAVLALVPLAPLAAAQIYPDKPIRVILPVPAGGTPDVLARNVTPGMAEMLGQSLVIDNRGGAGGRIAAELVARAAPDGYTIFLTSPGALTIVPHVSTNVPYDTHKDFAPIGLISKGAFLLLVHPSVPVKSVKELIALARSEPGKLNYSSAGNGNANHLAMEHFKSVAGVNFTHVPYKGAPQAVTDLLAGRVSVTMNSIPPILAHIKAGRLLPLAVAGAKRSPLLPGVPTANEAGVPNFEAGSWLGLAAPGKTPKRIIARLSEVMVKAVNAPATRARIEALGADPVASSPAEFAALIRREWELNAKIIKAAGVKVD